MKTGSLLEVFLVASATVLSINLIRCQDIVFPGDEDYSHVSGNAPVTEHKPLKVDTDRCPENMLLFPDEGKKSAWVCDCKELFVFFPANNTCHQLYKRGPCPPNHYVFLGLNETQPTCVENTCKQSDQVPFRGVCAKVGARAGPCAEDEVLNVNVTNYQLQCLSPLADPFVIIEAPKRSCPKGSRRSSLGICKLVL